MNLSINHRRSGAWGPALLIICGLVFLTGCPFNRASVPVAYPADVSGEQIQARISRLEKALAKPDPPAKLRNRQLLQLSMLYSHGENFEPDLEKSLAYLQQYAATDTAAGHNELDIEYVRLLLRRIQELTDRLAAQESDLQQCRNLKTRLETDLQNVQAKNKQLISENEKNKEIINKLKYLEIQLEQKRRRPSLW